MDATTRIGVRLPINTRQRIRKAAEARDRSESYMVRQWIEAGLAAKDGSEAVEIVGDGYRKGTVTAAELLNEISVYLYNCGLNRASVWLLTIINDLVQQQPPDAAPQPKTPALGVEV